jgi:hypothetical protein
VQANFGVHIPIVTIERDGKGGQQTLAFDVPLFVVIPTKNKRGLTSSYAHVQHYFLTKNEDKGFMSNVQGKNLNPIFK